MPAACGNAETIVQGSSRGRGKGRKGSAASCVGPGRHFCCGARATNQRRLSSSAAGKCCSFVMFTVHHTITGRELAGTRDRYRPELGDQGWTHVNSNTPTSSIYKLIARQHAGAQLRPLTSHAHARSRGGSARSRMQPPNPMPLGKVVSNRAECGYYAANPRLLHLRIPKSTPTRAPARGHEHPAPARRARVVLGIGVTHAWICPRTERPVSPA